MKITASLVKELREQTGAGMMECKKALEKASGSIEEAIVVLRKAGSARADKKAGRVAAEGVIVSAMSDDGRRAVLVEINCETDFVARDESLKSFANQVAEATLKSGSEDVDAILAQENERGEALSFVRHELVNKIGENIRIRRVAFMESANSLGVYRHGDRIGVLVALSKDNAELAKDIAMHVAAVNPLAIDETELSAELLQQERDIVTTQAKESGKPDAIIEKMVEGRMAKFVAERTLYGQGFVKNPDQTIADLLSPSDAKVNVFVRFEVGEGIEKVVTDFAEEVRSQVEGS